MWMINTAERGEMSKTDGLEKIKTMSDKWELPAVISIQTNAQPFMSCSFLKGKPMAKSYAFDENPAVHGQNGLKENSPIH